MKHRTNKMIVTALTTVVAGTMFANSCTARDIQKNLLSGGLDYVEDAAVNFLTAIVDTEELFEGMFGSGA